MWGTDPANLVGAGSTVVAENPTWTVTGSFTDSRRPQLIDCMFDGISPVLIYFSREVMEIDLNGGWEYKWDDDEGAKFTVRAESARS